MYFLALSQAAPLLVIVKARKTPAITLPMRRPPSASGPRTKPTTRGVITARSAGFASSLRAACVLMSTHFA